MVHWLGDTLLSSSSCSTGVEQIPSTSRVLVNKHVSIKLRMKCLDAVVTPTILFGLHTLALTGVQLSKLDSIQRRVLQSMVGWIRIQEESWHDTMSRMKEPGGQGFTSAPHRSMTLGQVSAFIRRPSCADQWLGDTCGHMESRVELQLFLWHPSADKDAY